MYPVLKPCFLSISDAPEPLPWHVWSYGVLPARWILRMLPGDAVLLLPDCVLGTRQVRSGSEHRGRRGRHVVHSFRLAGHPRGPAAAAASCAEQRPAAMKRRSPGITSGAGSTGHGRRRLHSSSNSTGRTIEFSWACSIVSEAE